MTQVNVGVDVRNPSHDISLSDGQEKWGLKLDGGIRGVQEVSQTASTILQRGGAQKWGDYDPTFGHIQQDTWHGGRGLEEFSDDPTRFFDSENMWTLTPGRLHPTLRWQFAESDHRDYNHIAFADMAWKALLGTQLYISSRFTAVAQDTSSYDADKCYIWLRRIGSPGTLTLKLYTDSAGGQPNAAMATASKTITVSDVTDFISVFKVFDWTGTETLTHNTVYHVVVYGASTDSGANHWEVGVNTAGTASDYSTAGSSWTAASYTMYYRVVDADVAVKWHYFVMDSVQMYKVSEPASGNSLLYEWNETNDEWDVCPDLSTDGTHALSGIVKSVAVAGDLAHMARGSAGANETIFVFDKDSADHKGRDDATAGNKADVVLAYNDPVDGPQIARAEHSGNLWSRSDVKAYGTNLAFGTDVKLKTGWAHRPLEMADYNDQAWVRTRSELVSMKNDRPSTLNAGLHFVIETQSHSPMLAKDLFLFIGWDYSIERLYSGTLDDIGPWKGAGLPDDCQGRVSALCSGVGMIFVAVDGGTSNYSNVYATTNGEDYHCIFKGPEKGQRIRNVFYQSAVDASGYHLPGRLWISYGADSIYMLFPEHTLNPLHDTAMSFHHEGVLATSTYTMGAERLPKLFKEWDLITEGLGTSADIVVDYKIDEDIGDNTAKWTEVTRIFKSPDDSIPLNLGNKRRIRFRIRARTSDADKPPKIIATVLDCLARTPSKRQWNMRVKISDLQFTKRGARDHDPKEFYKWLRKQSMSAKEILMRANDELMDDIYVVVQPPNLFRTFINVLQNWLSGVVTVTVLEA